MANLCSRLPQMVLLSLWILNACSIAIYGQMYFNVKNERQKIVMSNVIDDEGEFIEEYFRNFNEPWLFPESVPEELVSIGDSKKELIWTISASTLMKLIEPRIYNRLQSPGQIFGKTTLVEVAMYIESMSTFRAQTMDFEVDMYLMLSWKDHRLQHNSTHPILLTDYQIASRIWQPDLYFVNSKFSYMHRVTTPNFMVVIYQDGYVMKTMRIDVTLACMLNLHDFPMDEQNCTVIIQSYAFVEKVLKLVWHHNNEYPIHFNPSIKINDMDRVTVIDETCDSDYPLFRGYGRWSCLKGIITMKRKLQFHVFQIFIPSGMLVVISWLSFWLDIRASPARVSLTITTLLTLTTMSNGSRQELPHVPYMKANDIWFTVCQGFVFSVLLEYTLVNLLLGRLKSRKGTTKMETSFSMSSTLGTIPLITRQEAESEAGKTYTIRDWETYAKRVDAVSKLLFPSTFSIFIICYWCHYCG